MEKTIIATVSLLAYLPFVLICFWVYRSIRAHLKTTLSISFFILCITIGIIGYAGLLTLVAQAFNDPIKTILMGTAHATGIAGIFISSPFVFISLILYIRCVYLKIRNNY